MAPKYHPTALSGGDRKALKKELEKSRGMTVMLARVVAFNIFEGWVRDVSKDVAREIRRRCDLQLTDPPSGVQEFVERHELRERQLTLRLV
jgi:hypothetical protein